MPGLRFGVHIGSLVAVARHSSFPDNTFFHLPYYQLLMAIDK